MPPASGCCCSNWKKPVTTLTLPYAAPYWGLIMKANISETGASTPQEDRELFIRLADQAQRYGIKMLVDSSLSIEPLIEIAQNVLEGLETTDVVESDMSYDVL
jgi:hypothetical protein